MIPEKRLLLCCLPLALASFLPLFIDFHASGNVPDHRSSPNLLVAFVLNLGVSMALVIETLLESVRRSFLSCHGKDGTFDLMKKIMLISVLVIPSTGYFVTKDILSAKTFCNLMVSFGIFQRVLAVFPFLLNLSLSPSGYFSLEKIEMYVLILFGSGYAVFLPFWELEGILGIFFMVLTILMIFIGFCMVIRVTWPYLQYLRRCENIPEEEYVTLSYFIPIALGASYGFYSFIIFRGVFELTADTFLGFNVCFSLVAILGLQQPAKIESLMMFLSATRLIRDSRSFVSYVNHEIRTPLNAAVVGMSLVSDLVPLLPESNRDDAADTISQVAESIEVAVDILSALLTFDKISSNLLTLERTPENPVEIVTKTLSIFHLTSLEKGVNFSLVPLADLSRRRVSVDVHKISQVLRNLVSNALKFTPSGGSVTVNLLVTLKSANGDSPRSERSTAGSSRAPRIGALHEWLRVEVVDTGPGIASENLPRVFNEIVQFDANRLQQGKGTGLGLYISRSIVELHGGKVGVQSKGVGLGCSFWFELPLLPVSDSEEASQIVSLTDCRHELLRHTSDGTTFSGKSFPLPISPKKGGVNVSGHHDAGSLAGVELPLKGRRLLVVDDSALSAKMVAAFVKKLGAAVEYAENGVEALRKLTSSSPMPEFDAVIMDFHMPEMDGPEACLRLRELGNDIPVFGLTGEAGEEDRERFLQCGANEVFSKPLDVKRFRHALEQLLPPFGGESSSAIDMVNLYPQVHCDSLALDDLV